MVTYNPKLKLVIADVDETIADLYTDATPLMIAALNNLLRSGVYLFMISGGGLPSIRKRITDRLDPKLRCHILIGHCSGAEVWGFELSGELQAKPFYDLYNKYMDTDAKKRFRVAVAQLVDEFKLVCYPVMPIIKFRELSKGDSLSIMYDDRGPQITFEMPNSVALTAADGSTLDLRDRIIPRAVKLFAEMQIPVIPAKAGTLSIDIRLEQVSKDVAIKYILEHDLSLQGYVLGLIPGREAEEIEMWGDRFTTSVSSDRFMLYALPPEVRAVDFRQETAAEMPSGYNIVLWDGTKQLQDGLAEYLGNYFNLK